MPLEIITLPCLSDNYAFLAHDAETGATMVVDVPDAGPIDQALRDRGWTLSDVFLTHHHWDHVDGLADLLAKHPARVIGAQADAHRLPPLDLAVSEGDTITIGNAEGHILDVTGHTIGHLALHFPDSTAVFTADSLMALGCGRLFEGTPDQMWISLSKLAVLPPETMVYSGHEYTQSNARFALSLEPNNTALQERAALIEIARQSQTPTVPSTLALELATNPFLRPDSPEIRASAGLPDATKREVFAQIRKMKDSF